ncbi:MAG: large conductance mechanosensitive channel protein MscL [bacterium]|nr:large conductance mechanosensitive channel protein MscL [bacterium]
MIPPVKKFVSEFRKFALKANFVDMVVGIIIGMKFTTLVNSLVKDVIMPPFSLFTSYSEFENMQWILRPADMEGEAIIREAVTINYGTFLVLAIDFLVVATVMYFVVKGYNLYKSRTEDPDDNTEETPKNIELLKSIDDGLKELNNNITK